MIVEFRPNHPLWHSYIAHLECVKMAQWVVDDEKRPKSNVHFLGAVNDGHVIGHITIKLQTIVVPATDWSGGQPTPLTNADNTELHETFVQTFTVEEVYRRQGYGRALQLAALQLTKQLGAYQMRSWSSLDKPANYALKLSLGFAAYPAIFETETGLKVSGVYFVKTV